MGAGSGRRVFRVGRICGAFWPWVSPFAGTAPYVCYGVYALFYSLDPFMTVLRVVLGDQLTRDVASLQGLDVARDVVFMAEVKGEGTYVAHHKQKIVLVLSAMRHFAQDLLGEGVRVDYVQLDAAGNSGTLAGEIARAVKRVSATRVVCTYPGEWRVLEMMRTLQDELGVPVEILEDDRFIASRADFARWAGDKKSLRMEYFYREMRRSTDILMDKDEPVGGAWNFDQENRKPMPASVRPPDVERFAPDAMTRDVIALVERVFASHMGALDRFGWAVTRADALRALDDFITHRLANFGDYQDAMKAGTAFMHHSILAPYLNIGLLDPREVCRAAEVAFKRGLAPLNCVEGFIRQILGWREYVRGIYWHFMPKYADSNFLEASRPLPDFYWTGETKMHCMGCVIDDTRRHAYSHHIQRLMITGNFALLAGLEPKAVEAWYLAVYADAFEWVELPNTHGMALFADGGVLASKPYAASGAYIDRMSNFCKGCDYDPKIKLGEGACPFNYLYWNFLIENEGALKRNPRMGMPYKTLSNMTPERRAEIVEQSSVFLDGLVG